MRWNMMMLIKTKANKFLITARFWYIKHCVVLHWKYLDDIKIDNGHISYGKYVILYISIYIFDFNYDELIMEDKRITIIKIFGMRKQNNSKSNGCLMS